MPASFRAPEQLAAFALAHRCGRRRDRRRLRFAGGGEEEEEAEDGVGVDAEPDGTTTAARPTRLARGRRPAWLHARGQAARGRSSRSAPAAVVVARGQAGAAPGRLAGAGVDDATVAGAGGASLIRGATGATGATGAATTLGAGGGLGGAAVGGASRGRHGGADLGGRRLCAAAVRFRPRRPRPPKPPRAPRPRPRAGCRAGRGRFSGSYSSLIGAVSKKLWSPPENSFSDSRAGAAGSGAEAGSNAGSADITGGITLAATGAVSARPPSRDSGEMDVTAMGRPAQPPAVGVGDRRGDARLNGMHLVTDHRAKRDPIRTRARRGRRGR